MFQVFLDHVSKNIILCVHSVRIVLGYGRLAVGLSKNFTKKFHVSNRSRIVFEVFLDHFLKIFLVGSISVFMVRVWASSQ